MFMVIGLMITIIGMGLMDYEFYIGFLVFAVGLFVIFRDPIIKKRIDKRRRSKK